MTSSNRGKVFVEGLQLDAMCDICGRDRAHGNHRKCSRARQEYYKTQAKTSSAVHGANDRHAGKAVVVVDVT